MIRLARQGTPNAFIANVLEVFAPYEGKLVRVEVCEGGYIVDDSVTTKEAEVFWAANRPELPFVPAADQEYDGLDGLLEIDLSGESGVPPESRFGGKSTNLARLQRATPRKARGTSVCTRGGVRWCPRLLSPRDCESSRGHR